MLLTEEIRNYEVTAPLDPELIKTSREYRVLAILKYAYPAQFSKLHKAEAPDLQDTDGELGVEVTWGGSPNDEQITSESIKYSQAKTKAEKERRLKKIRNKGGDIIGKRTTYPLGKEEKDKIHAINIFQKKVNKVESYRKYFQNVGLAVMLDVPLPNLHGQQWGGWFSEINNDSFSFIALIHWSGINIYDFKTGEYSSRIIDKDDMDVLKKIGRMAAEGIIKDDDPVWDL